MAIPAHPSQGLYGDKLKCTLVSDLADTPRIAITVPFPPIPENTREKQVRSLDLNNGGLSVFKYGPTRKNVILPSNFWPSWVLSLLEEMDDRNVAVSVMTMESGRVSAAMPLRWKIGGSPNKGEYSATAVGHVYVIQYNPATGATLMKIADSDIDDILPFLPYPPCIDTFGQFPFDRGALVYKGGQSGVKNANFLSETASVPQFWNFSSASGVPVAETHYGVLENASFLNDDLSVLWLSKPAIDANNYYWITDPMTVAAGESGIGFVGVQTFGATARVELKYNTGLTVGVNITDLYTSTIIDTGTTAPVGAVSVELLLALTSNTGEVWFSAPQFQRDRCHNTVIGIRTDNTGVSSWSGSELYYDLPNAFHPQNEEYAVAFCYVQPGWRKDICTVDTVLSFESVDHGNSDIQVKLVGGYGNAQMYLYVDSVLKDTIVLVNYDIGDTFLILLVYKAGSVEARAVNLSRIGTTYLCNTATLPVSPLTRLYPGNESHGDQLDGLIGNIVVLTHTDDAGSGETIATMIDYLTNSHMIDIARRYLGRKYDLNFQMNPHIRKLVSRGALVLTETEKY